MATDTRGVPNAKREKKAKQILHTRNSKLSSKCYLAYFESDMSLAHWGAGALNNLHTRDIDEGQRNAEANLLNLEQ